MIEESFARLRTHRNNVQRYRHLLETRLTDLERQFIEKRLSEEQSAIESLAALTFPLIFKDPAASPQDPRAA